MGPPEPKRVTLREFTRQSEKFPDVEFFRSKRKLEDLVNFTGVSGDELVLEVAAGAAFVGRTFARRVGGVLATDLVPAMMRRANTISREEGITNMIYAVADADHLPFADQCFDIVVTRYGIHHFHDPSSTLSELRRVAKPTARLVFEDIIAPEDTSKQLYLNMVQRVHDPSHVQTLKESELELILGTSFKIVDKQPYAVDLDYETWVKMADTPMENAERAEQLLIDSIEGDKTGEGVEWRDGTLRWTQHCVRFLCLP